MLLLPMIMVMSAMPTFEESGVWYEAGQAVGGIPLGGLGTGFLELNSDGRFGTTTMENHWLKPRPVTPGSGFIIRAGGKILNLLTPATKVESRMQGRWPAADIEFAPISIGEGASVVARIHAFAPVIPHAYETSGLPVIFFEVEMTYTAPKESPNIDSSVVLRWIGKDPVAQPKPVSLSDEVPAQCGVMLPVDGGTYALGALGGPESVRAWTYPDGTMCAETGRQIHPNETVSYALAMAWHFPEWSSSDGETLRHHYAARFDNAGEVLTYALARAPEVRQRIDAWQGKVYAADVPAQLKDACVNGLYVLARNSWWLDDGRFFQSESFTGCPITETFVCRFYGSFPLALMWPELEKATMREIAKNQAGNGQIPFGFGTPMGTKTPMMDLQVPIVSTQFALTTWRNYALWKDPAYLEEAYPAAKKALQFALTLDTDNDGLVNDAPGNEEGFPANQYYDIWPWWGTSAYVGGISLAAWRAGEEMAKVRGDAEFEKEMHDLYERGAKAYDEKLWTGSHYRLYSGDAKHPASDTSLTNALCGQWYAWASGLGDILPREKVAATIDTVFRLNVAASPYGMVNGVKPDGTPDTTFKDHSAVLTIGELWCFTAMAAHEGHRKDDAIRVFNTSYENIALNQKTPWNIPWCLDPATGAIKWGIHYYSNPCVWTVLQALDTKNTYAHLAKDIAR